MCGVSLLICGMTAFGRFLDLNQRSDIYIMRHGH